MINALSLCGGGIRGLLQVLVLAELERQTGRLTREHFSWVAGTSVGACITALIQAGVPMKDAVQFFTGPTAKKVFSPTGPFSTLKRLSRGWMYDPKNLADALRAAMGPAADWTLDECPSNVLVIAVAMDGHTWFFRRGGATGSVKLVDAVVASAAAPTYFNAWPIPVLGQKLWFFDGGASGFANPSHQLCVEMFEPPSKVTPRDVRMICLGTGYHKPETPDGPPRSLLGVVEWSLSTLLDSAVEEADRNVVRQYLQPTQYRKLNWELGKDIDMANVAAIPDLVRIGTEAARATDWKALLEI